MIELVQAGLFLIILIFFHIGMKTPPPSQKMMELVYLLIPINPYPHLKIFLL